MLPFETVWKRWKRRTMLDVVRAGMIYHLASLAEVARFAELGCCDGGMALLLADGFRDRIVHAYDTFDGVPIQGVEPGSGMWEGRFAALTDTVAVMGQFPNCKVRPGLFPESRECNFAALRFSLVHLDADTYQATHAGLSYFWPQMMGFLILDDFDRPETPGVRRALEEYLPDWEEFRYSYMPNINQLILESP